MRALIQKHLGEDQAKIYDETIKNCKLGRAIKENRTWAPLCPEYPNLKGVTCTEIDEFIGENIKFADNTQLIKDYLHHVKVYDRDEIYTAFKRIGKQIKSNYPKYRNILRDSSTIYVTTPRGGHEMLSIFAYANGIKKEQIPSDITWQLDLKPEAREEYGIDAITEDWIREKEVSFEMVDTKDIHMFGKDWMGNRSEEVKTIFIVDDIIASGQQINRTAGELSEMFPDAEINSITLCKREDEDCDMLESITECYYTDTETIGIEKFKELREQGEIDNEYITCLFPHACPDGRSDDIMIELMGGERCPPEKRIARRDL
jgi:hypothetical protein